MTKLDEQTFRDLFLHDDEGPFENEMDAESRQEWLEQTFDMAYRVCEYQGKFYCFSTMSLPIHLIDQ